MLDVEVDGPLDLAALTAPVTSGRGPLRVWRGRWADGAATVALERTRSGVRAHGWGPGRHAALAAVPALLGLDDAAARSFVALDPRVEALLREAPEVRVGRSGQVWPTLLRAVLGQRVTGRSAGASGRSLALAWGDPAPGPFEGLRLPAAPERLAERTYAELHLHNLDRRRAELVIGLARRARRLEALTARPVAEAMAALGSLPGVGPWTSAHLALEVWGYADAVAIGDYHLANHVVWALTGRPRGTDDEMLELLRPWSGHRARVIRLLLQAPAPPRFGPRGDDVDIRHS